MRPAMHLLVKVVTAVAALAWIGTGCLIGIDYAIADESTAKAGAPELAIVAVFLLPLAGGAWFVRAATLIGSGEPIPMRRCVAGGIVCLLAWSWLCSC